MKEQQLAVSPPALWKTPAAAAYLGIQPSTLEQWRWTGGGPNYLKLGKFVRYRQSDLDDYLVKRVFSSTTEAQAAQGKI